MESRKLIKSGPSSLLVSIPNDWLKAHNLTKGSNVYLDIEEHQITIIAKEQIKEHPKREITVTPKTPALLQEQISAALLKSIDTVHIDMKKCELSLKEIITVFDYFPGITYSIFDEKISMHNSLNKAGIKPTKDLKELLQMNSIMLEKILHVDEKTVQDTLILIKNLKRKSLIIESVVNDTLMYKTGLAKEEQMKYVGLKLVFQEIPTILDKEIYLVEQVSTISTNEEKLHKMVELLKKTTKAAIRKKKDEKEENMIAVKQEISLVQRLIAREQNKQRILLLKTIESMYESTLKLLSASDLFN